MEVKKTAIEGVYIIEPRVFEDARGYFFESFSQREFDEKIGPVTFVQDNESKSSYGVMRGLHFQRPPFTQSKLVRCVKGAVLDVAVDIRKGSPTYGQHVAVELTEENHLQFFIPKGLPTALPSLVRRQSSNISVMSSIIQRLMVASVFWMTHWALTGEYPPTMLSYQKRTRSIPSLRISNHRFA